MSGGCGSSREARPADVGETRDTTGPGDTAELDAPSPPSDTAAPDDSAEDAAPRADVDGAADSDATADGDGNTLADAAADVDVSADVQTGPVALSGCRAGAPDWVPLPEASGAALLPGGRYLLVADSGNSGAALVVEPSTQANLALVLPLGTGAGDDVEGLETAPDGRVFGLTSAGWLRAWTIEVAAGVASATLVFGPVAVSADAEWACASTGVNCGPNYEGICLHPSPPTSGEGASGCAGWAVSKARGELVCLRPEGEGYRVDAAVRVAIAPADRLSGCAYEPVAPYRLVVGGNIYSGDRLWEVGPNGATLLPDTGAGNQEAVLVMEGAAGPRILSFGDLQELGEGQSPRVVFECR